MLQREGEGTEALAARTVEPDRRLGVGMPLAAFAGLVRLDPSCVKGIDIASYARIERAQPLFAGGGQLDRARSSPRSGSVTITPCHGVNHNTPREGIHVTTVTHMSTRYVDSGGHGKAAPDQAIRELCAALDRAMEYLAPWTMHSAPGEDEAYERARELVERYKPAA